jgi:hypothetical protein
MVTGLWLQVEVVGCPTVCRHCWAQGVPYPAMPVDDVAWVLEQAHRFCDAHGLGFGAYPMHELAAHPHAVELLRLFADRICQASSLGAEPWADLAGHTEAAWVARALAGEWPVGARHDGEVLELVCRPNLDLHTGVAGWYRERHGNLRTGGPSAVLAGALEMGGRSFEALWFDSGPLPSVAELAARHGDSHGQGLHFSADSARYL